MFCYRPIVCFEHQATMMLQALQPVIIGISIGRFLQSLVPYGWGENQHNNDIYSSDNIIIGHSESQPKVHHTKFNVLVIYIYIIIFIYIIVIRDAGYISTISVISRLEIFNIGRNIIVHVHLPIFTFVFIQGSL